jgi:hypothetical protein
MKKTLTCHSKRQGILLGIRQYFPKCNFRQLNLKSLQRSTRCLISFAATAAIISLPITYVYGSVVKSNGNPLDWRDENFLLGTHKAHIVSSANYVFIQWSFSKRNVVEKANANYYNPSQL